MCPPRESSGYYCKVFYFYLCWIIRTAVFDLLSWFYWLHQEKIRNESGKTKETEARDQIIE